MEGSQLGAIRGDWIGAEKAFQRAIDLVGEEKLAAENFGYLIWLFTVGHIDQAIKGFQSFYRRDPLASNRALQMALDCAGRYDEAEAEYKRDLAKPADPTLAEHYAFLRCLARRDVEGAKSHLSHLLALGASLLPIPRDLLTSFDDKQAALAIIRKRFDDPAYQNGLAVGVLANLAAYFGDDLLALDGLRRAAIGRRHGIIEAWHPLFARARKTAGFKQFARDVGLYDYWRKSGHWGDFARAKGDDDFEIIR